VVAGAKLIGLHTWVGASEDVRKALDPLDCLSGGPEESSAYLERMVERTRGLIRQGHRWCGVEALGTALMAQRRLSYRRCHAVIAGAVRTSVRAGSERRENAEGRIVMRRAARR
jgi:hypothetical protein